MASRRGRAGGPLGSEAETERIGAALAAIVRPGLVVGLVGPLGAGKTRLVRAIAEAMGADPGRDREPDLRPDPRIRGPLPDLPLRRLPARLGRRIRGDRRGGIFPGRRASASSNGPTASRTCCPRRPGGSPPSPTATAGSSASDSTPNRARITSRKWTCNRSSPAADDELGVRRRSPGASRRWPDGGNRGSGRPANADRGRDGRPRVGGSERPVGRGAPRSGSRCRSYRFWRS